MKINPKRIIEWAILIIIAAFGMGACKPLPVEVTPPPEPAPSIEEKVLPEDIYEIQPPEDAVAMTHEVEGFEDCTGCHYAEGSDEGATTVDEQHYCSACHEMVQPFHFDHGSPPNASCTLCHRPE